MTHSRLEDRRKHASRMVVDLRADPDEERAHVGGALLRVRFGPHEIATRLRVLPVITKKGTLGEPYVLELVGHPATEPTSKAFTGDGDDLVVGRLTLPKTMEDPPQPPPDAQGRARARGRGRPRPVRADVVLVAGETPQLRIGGSINRTLEGTRRTDVRETQRLKVAVSAKALTLALGTTEVSFPLEKGSFSKEADADAPGGNR